MYAYYYFYHFVRFGRKEENTSYRIYSNRGTRCQDQILKGWLFSRNRRTKTWILLVLLVNTTLITSQWVQDSLESWILDILRYFCDQIDLYKILIAWDKMSSWEKYFIYFHLEIGLCLNSNKYGTWFLMRILGSMSFNLMYRKRRALVM